MTEAELQQLRGYYHAMLRLDKTLAAIPGKGGGTAVDDGVYSMIDDEVGEIENAFPGILPPFRRENFFTHHVGRGAYYRFDALKLYVSRAVGRLTSAIEDTESTPVTETRTFAYVHDNAVRTIVARDYREAQLAFIARCWKSVIILCGGLIEAVLLDLAQQNEAAARSAKAAPNQPNLKKWSLADLIDVTVELKLIGAGVEKLSHPVRQYRNLIHPGVELRSELVFGEEEARIALEVLHIVDRDLSK